MSKVKHRVYMSITVFALALAAWDHDRLIMALLAGGALWFGDTQAKPESKP